jgi:PHD/YefM family antitoxin component YafN of YafNO toxin-antitoxin module
MRTGESMIELHPEILKKNGKSEFVVLPYEEYEALQELLADYQDLLDLRDAKRKESGEASVPLHELKEQFGL